MQSVFWTLMIVFIGCLICSLGLQKGVEKISKWMMSCLLAVMLLLVVRSLTLDNALEGLRFYLVPDFQKLKEAGIFNAIYASFRDRLFLL